MNNTSALVTPAWSTAGLLTRTLRARTLDILAELHGGTVTLHEGQQAHTFGHGGPLRATVRIHDPSAWRRLALGGSVGAAESYLDGEWDSPDLTALLRLLAQNLELVNGRMEGGVAAVARLALTAAYAVQRNTLSGSRRNISAHYDLGNDMFSLFLDREHAMYSSAIYPREDASLEEASTYKLDRALDTLGVGPDHHLLEIGTGWGGLAIHAAKTRGCRVTTTTISSEQHDFARARIAEEGLQDRITLLSQDYRELSGTYDRVISIEMIEAVGHQYLANYLGKIESLLAQDGMALLQAITIRDQRYEAAKREMDFIKRYIFPGGFLPSHNAISRALMDHTELNILDLFEIGPHYARTLRDWRVRFDASLDSVRALGYDERFVRMWHYYLSYCEAGFEERTIGTCQLLLGGPHARRSPLPR